MNIGKEPIKDIASMFRHGDDVLMVPFIGVLGKHRRELLKLVAPLGATLYNFSQQEELKVSQAATFAYINECYTAPGRIAIASSGFKGGAPKKYKSKALEPVKAHLPTYETSSAFPMLGFMVSSTDVPTL